MYYKLFKSITLVASLLITLLGEAEAVSSISLGHCTDDQNHCQDKWEIFGDPSWDQTLPLRAKNKLTKKENELVLCNSFSSSTEYKIKLCACQLCKGCDASLCQAATKGVCTNSRIGQLFSICSADIH